MLNLNRYIYSWVEMIYIDRHGQFSQRRVFVYGVGQRYMIGFCAQRRKVRRFNIDRILSALLAERAV